MGVSATVVFYYLMERPNSQSRSEAIDRERTTLRGTVFSVVAQNSGFRRALITALNGDRRLDSNWHSFRMTLGCTHQFRSIGQQ